MHKQVIANMTFTFKNSAEMNEKVDQSIETKEKELVASLANTRRLKKELKSLKKFRGVSISSRTSGQEGSRQTSEIHP